MLTFFSEHLFVLWNLSIYLGQRGGEGRGVGLPESPPQTVERWARDGLSPRFYINQMYNAPGSQSAESGGGTELWGTHSLHVCPSVGPIPLSGFQEP